MSTGRPDGEEPYSAGWRVILRMLLGTQLRRLRVGFKARDITDLLSLYGATDEELRATLLAMAQRADQRRDVEHYLKVADRLRGEALTPAASRAFSEHAAVGHGRMRAAWESRRARLPRDHGHLAMMDASMSYLRQFVPAVLAAVRFDGGPGMDGLLSAVTILAALNAAGCLKVFADKKSGKNAEREELGKALGYLRPGDILVVESLDRLGRSLQDLINIVSALRRQGVGLRSLKEAIDTTTPGGRLVFHVFAALAEFIRELIVEGTNEGLDAARARGQRLGRPPP